jgi:hypothetical protein
MSTTGKRLALGVTLAAAASAAAIVLAPAAVATKGSAGANGLRHLRGVNFIGNCRFSHRSMDDPIVYPGKPGASHDHSFVGNRTTNAFSTLDSLLAGASTCRRDGETAAYWMPTLNVDGQPVPPLAATIYYRRKTLKRVTALPAGFKMIAGDSMATSPQPKRVTYWNCGVQTGVPASSEPPACPAGRGSGLRLHVVFPACWNGSDLDSANHKSHVAYAMRGRCPAGYDVAIPEIALIYRYPVTGTHAFELASGSVYSAHADFFNGWDQETLETLVNTCLNRLRHCGRG